MKYTMAKELVNLFEEKLEKFANKFAKYGGYSYEKSEPYVCEDEDSRWYRYTVVDIEVDAKYKVGDYYITENSINPSELYANRYSFSPLQALNGLRMLARI